MLHVYRKLSGPRRRRGSCKPELHHSWCFNHGLILGLPILPCVASVRLPLDSVVCPVLSTTNGVLASVVQSI
ncbi:hypothetical protein Pfo_016322, partial [Paulownia fortunei]